MERAGGPAISTWTPTALLGRPLNDIEERHAPGRLYTAGTMRIPLPRPRVAIVGSRRATAEGLAEAGDIARVLTREEVVIVSGLAKGIDTAAHKATIEEGGKTIAVLGTPLDRSYPAENKELQAEIIKHHLAVSQFKVDSEVYQSNFIRRNRTMALIADASVIVEAGETSGSISQGYEALRLGRPLFIWKRLFEPSFNWPKEMTKFGAMKLTDPKELLEHLPSKHSTLQIPA
ncbi:MAG: DNA-processing protein DprA [Thaumarchaeota archaeon]|nr:DNA-processing protein DprA [Nitrososphaerota archaeon]